MATTLPNPIADEPAVGEQTTSTPPQARRQGRARVVLKSLLAVLLALVTGYAAGRVHGWIAMRDQMEAERNAAIAAERARRDELTQASELLAQLRQQRVELATIASLHEGYRALQLALNALDARNFGTAEAHLRDAEHTLQPLSNAVPGLREPLAGLSALHLAVATDVGQQRQAVRELADALSSLIEARRAASPASASQP